MENIESLKEGRRVAKTWMQPLALVELIEKEAKESNEPESRIVEGYILDGVRFRAQAETETE